MVFSDDPGALPLPGERRGRGVQGERHCHRPRPPEAGDLVCFDPSHGLVTGDVYCVADPSVYLWRHLHRPPTRTTLTRTPCCSRARSIFFATAGWLVVRRVCEPCCCGVYLSGVPSVPDERHRRNPSCGLRGFSHEGVRRGDGDGVAQPEEGQRLQGVLGKRQPDHPAA